MFSLNIFFLGSENLLYKWVFSHSWAIFLSFRTNRSFVSLLLPLSVLLTIGQTMGDTIASQKLSHKLRLANFLTLHFFFYLVKTFLTLNNNNSFTDCTHYRPTIEGLIALGALHAHIHTQTLHLAFFSFIHTFAEKLNFLTNLSLLLSCLHCFILSWKLVNYIA